jgi:hypothetical protein
MHPPTPPIPLSPLFPLFPPFPPVRTLHGGERSCVSLRDVARCITVYRFFAQHFHSRGNVNWTLEQFFQVDEKAHTHIKKALICSLAYCYYSRLPSDHR